MTIKDIAKYCDVSVSTVSRVLNGRPDVSEAVRSRVLQAMETLHYVPNTSARALGQISSDSIGMIVRGGGNPFYTDIIQSAEQKIQEAGYTLLVRHIPSTADEISVGSSLATSGRLKGIIFLGGQFDYDSRRVARLHVPFVSCTYTNSFGLLEDSDYSSVSIDDRAEAAKAVRYLIENGHRRIAILLNSKDDRSIGQLRYMGYLDALKEAGISPDDSLVCETDQYDMDAAYNSMKALIDRETGMSAVFVIADSLALAAIKAVHDSGRSVPDDISIISIDGLVESKYSIPTLTTMVQPRSVLGRQAAELLLDEIGSSLPARHIRLAAEMRMGGSVRNIS